MQSAHPIRIRILGLQSSVSIQCLQSSPLYPGFTEFPSLSRVYRNLVSIQGLQSSRLYPRFTEFPSLSRVYRVPISIQGLQSSRLYPGFTEFLSLSRVYRVPVSIQDLQSSRLYLGFTEFLYLYFPCFWQEGRGKRSVEKPLQFCTIIFSFFPSRVYCYFIPQKVLFSHKKLERVV